MNNFHLLTTSVSSLIKIADDAKLTCTRDRLFLQASNAEHRVVAVLELPRSSFGGFPACSDTYVDGLDLHDLQMTLDPSHREHTMHFCFNLHQRILSFTFLGPNNAVRNCEFPFKDPPIYVNFATHQYAYHVYVGIPSQVFYHIMGRLNGINADDKVVITVTQTEVRFASGDVMNTLRTEDLGCSIGGMGGTNGIVELTICKFSINALLEASRLCATVWLFKSITTNSPDLVYCPVGSIGSIKFYHIQHGFPIPDAPSCPPPKPRRKRRKLQHNQG